MPFVSALVPAGARMNTWETYGRSCFPVTTSDTVDALNTNTGEYFKYIVAKTAGDAAVLGYENADGDTAQIISVAAGQILPGRIRRIKATNTTATFCGWSD